jgi:hypothetical protein
VRWNTYAKRPRRSFIMMRREGMDAPGAGDMSGDIVLDLSGAEWMNGGKEEVEEEEREEEKRHV